MPAAKFQSDRNGQLSTAPPGYSAIYQLVGVKSKDEFVVVRSGKKEETARCGRPARGKILSTIHHPLSLNGLTFVVAVDLFRLRCLVITKLSHSKIPKEQIVSDIPRHVWTASRFFEVSAQHFYNGE